MSRHFISYSSADAREFALRLCAELEGGEPPRPVWLDRRDIRPGQDWDEAIAEAVKTCLSLLFVMTPDSVEDCSECKREWSYALRYKKPVIPLKLHPGAETPFRLGTRQHIDFTHTPESDGGFGPSLARLREHLAWLGSPAGALQSLKDRLADARRDLRRATDDAQRARLADDIGRLELSIERQDEVVRDTGAAERRVEESIARGLEDERRPARTPAGAARGRFINPPPGLAPSHFQDRYIETGLVGAFLKDDALRMFTVAGRGGTGKTALACRLLKSLEGGRLPDDGGPLEVDGILYLSAAGTRRVNAPNLFSGLSKLLPAEAEAEFDALTRGEQSEAGVRMRALLSHFEEGRTVVLLDNFEDLIDPQTLSVADAELGEALRALLEAPHHCVKVIVTTRAAPHDLALVEPGRQRRLDLDEGLPSPYAENVLREMDADGKVGLRDAPAALLREAQERTRGYPRALEALFAILSADRDTSLREILDDTARLLPENVVRALVGEAFSRLGPTSQQVMQALAVYGRPVTPAAVDFLLQPYRAGIDSASILKRLVNTHFARREAGRYYLHPVDRAYALSRELPPPLTRHALLHRAAEYFRQARLPREHWKAIDDLAPLMAEFDLRCEAGDYDQAARVLGEMDWQYLITWGFHQHVAELHERLLGRLTDPLLEHRSLAHAGLGYWRMGRTREGVACFEQAWELALRCGDRLWAGTWLGNLGSCHAELGEIDRAIECCEQAIAFARETGSLEDEGRHLGNLTELLVGEGRYEEAVRHGLEGARIAAETGIPNLISYNNGYLALARLCSGDLRAAREAALAALAVDEPCNNHYAHALHGIVTLRLGEVEAARGAFTRALAEAEVLLARNVQNYCALDSRALALSGLATGGEPARASEAAEAYRAARAVNKGAGTVTWSLRLFDELARADAAGALAGVRAAAGGE
jgi:tetratricopeptide (TPR) repeat protein